MGDFQSVLLQHTRLQIKLKEVLWMSEFAVNERQASGGTELREIHRCADDVGCAHPDGLRLMLFLG
jgi:hypothetical protein